MYKRLYTLLNKNNVICNLHFEFRQQYSTSRALINITGNIRKALDDGNIGCGVFVELQKAFDTVHHGICGVQMIGLNLLCLITINMYLYMDMNLVLLL